MPYNPNMTQDEWIQRMQTLASMLQGFIDEVGRTASKWTSYKGTEDEVAKLSDSLVTNINDSVANAQAIVTHIQNNFLQDNLKKFM